MRRSARIRIKVQDRISELPDDILLSIISKLPLKEALRTSILSARWRNLCSFITHLNFPPFLLVNSKRKYKRKKKDDRRPSYGDVDGNEVAERFSSYVNMVDRTLDSHKGNRIKEFRVNAYRLKGASLEKWLVFALSKQAQVIEINMRGTFLLLDRSFGDTYSLGFKTLMSKGLNLECLKQLCLCGVGVSDDDLALLVSTCVALESLSIREYLDNVSIVGHSSLKHLEISGAGYFINQSLEIRDMANLVSLECCLYDDCTLRLENVPKLVEFRSGESHIGMSVREVLSKMPSSVRDQLQLLRLSTILCKDVLYPTRIMQPSRCENAKILELEVVDLEDEPQYVPEMFPRFIAIYPMLQKLKIKMSWDDDCPCRSRRRSLVRKPIREFLYLGKRQLSPVLKELEIEGYSIYLGSRSVLELVSYIIQHSPLRQLVVKPYRDSTDDKSRVGVHSDFRPIIPDSTNFKII